MNKLTECILNKNSSLTPIWFMRQAGRYLPEFREIRQKNQNFIKLCLNPDLVTDITLQPMKRFSLDAAIIFSDILMIPYGLNQEVEFKKNFGPKLGSLDIDKIININNKEFIKKLSPVYEGIRKVKNKIENQDLIGFVGAPWTLLVYMMNRESPKKNFDINYINKDKSKSNKILKKIEETICLHVDKQIEAGANVIQIFDSWAGLLPSKELENYCYIPNLKIVEHIKKSKIPVICFPKGIKNNYENFCSVVKPDCISIDYEIDPNWIKNKANGITIQGGMDPKILLTEKENIKKNVEKFITIFSDYPYIFNLGHGVMPETRPEMIEYVIKIIREKKR
tara:strand:+ start:815 stop:1825 length:1011 start_codon:yes stop_codon:yes gene_type:complete